jgi:hypothetical protein
MCMCIDADAEPGFTTSRGMTGRSNDEDEIVFKGIELSKDFKEFVKKTIDERREAVQEKGRLVFNRLIEIGIVSEIPRLASRSEAFRRLANKLSWFTVMRDFKTDPTLKDHELLNPEAIDAMMSKYISEGSASDPLSKILSEKWFLEK